MTPKWFDGKSQTCESLFRFWPIRKHRSCSVMFSKVCSESKKVLRPQVLECMDYLRMSHRWSDQNKIQRPKSTFKRFRKYEISDHAVIHITYYFVFTEKWKKKFWFLCSSLLQEWLLPCYNFSWIGQAQVKYTNYNFKLNSVWVVEIKRAI